MCFNGPSKGQLLLFEISVKKGLENETYLTEDSENSNRIHTFPQSRCPMISTRHRYWLIKDSRMKYWPEMNISADDKSMGGCLSTRGQCTPFIFCPLKQYILRDGLYICNCQREITIRVGKMMCSIHHRGSWMKKIDISNQSKWVGKYCYIWYHKKSPLAKNPTCAAKNTNK